MRTKKNTFFFIVPWVEHYPPTAKWVKALLRAKTWSEESFAALPRHWDPERKWWWISNKKSDCTLSILASKSFLVLFVFWRNVFAWNVARFPLRALASKNCLSQTNRENQYTAFCFLSLLEQTWACRIFQTRSGTREMAWMQEPLKKLREKKQTKKTQNLAWQRQRLDIWLALMRLSSQRWKCGTSVK